MSKTARTIAATFFMLSLVGAGCMLFGMIHPQNDSYQYELEPPIFTLGAALLMSGGIVGLAIYAVAGYFLLDFWAYCEEVVL